MTLTLRASSLRLRIFLALAAATLCGALATGLYAVIADVNTLGFSARLVKVTPKALALAALLLPAAAVAAAFVGGRLARPIEQLTEAATRIAEGHRATRLPRGEGGEMQRLARALMSMRRELEGKPYAAAFLRDAWHDLKTPVAALQATLEVLDDDAFDDPVAARHFLANLRRSTDQLERTLADLVTLARFETASLSPDEPASMNELVQDAVARIEPLAEATNVELTANGRNVRNVRNVRDGANASDRLRCDPAAIGRALGNLLENAVSATPGGKVAIAVDAEKRGRITVDVVNEPAAVPADARRRLFERAPKSRNGRGSGLGLAMVRAAVEAHGGTIRFVEMGPPRVRVRLELPR
jgi:two-component system, OmpR family, sensor histidine kinase CreC